ncbi:L,D-transpeptidase family protein [Thiohalomonas denitrificans]|uniref:Murein L,D-transpeptidase YcbB/YkuD n=1 Tax=Thiohalomonas denitrificans TaxID=415747 RepID=A0A1G5Q8Z5_9GAMM|nr:L,D-transpeptidase family protein [Thiohalomonas denitrificans]SCZ58147.1 Murein L,D-transpeptidase YcbB/YkuD [Thiohalomonas denitrificans]
MNHCFVNGEFRAGPRRALAVVVLCCGLLNPAAADAESGVGKVLRNWLQSDQAMPADVARLPTRSSWHSVYSSRGYTPLWFDSRGLNPRAREFLTWLANERHGLEYARTPYIPLGEVSSERIAAVELQLTHALLVTASELYRGQTDPYRVDPSWHWQRDYLAPGRIIELLADGQSVATVLDSLAPQATGYRQLRRALRDYRAAARMGGFHYLPPGESLKRGDRQPRIATLRRRLAQSGDLSLADVPDPGFFDGQLERGVRLFQARHGLRVDGRVGPDTRAALNVPVEERLAQIRASLERWRWMPRTEAQRFVMVNVAGFRLSLYDADREQLNMRVIVGRAEKEWETPAFSSPIRYLVLNPGWVIPEAIARDELLPRLLSDPSYFARQGIQVSREGHPVELTRDDVLAALQLDREEPFPYRLEQEPGSRNALGQIKLVLPNRFAIYLHDTPDRHLFTRRDRALSHGCIRLEKPFALAAALLDDTWGSGRLLEAAESGAWKKITLPEPVPVHFVYQTAWVDSEGRVQFRDDVYGRNRELIAALQGGLPGFISNVN